MNKNKVMNIVAVSFLLFLFLLGATAHHLYFLFVGDVFTDNDLNYVCKQMYGSNAVYVGKGDEVPIHCVLEVKETFAPDKIWRCLDA